MVEYHCYIMCCYITTYDTRFSTIYTAVPNNLCDSQTNSVAHLVTILTKSIALSKFLYIFYSQIPSDLTIEYLCNRNTAGLESLLTLLYRVYRPDVLRVVRDALMIPFQKSTPADLLDFKPQRSAKYKCPVQHKYSSGSSYTFRTSSHL